jgi:Rrf2 family protein
MLKLTKKADYSLIALRHFAAHRLESGADASASAKEVADRCGIPLPLLSKLLQKLGKAGFLTAEQGTNGGYRLARDPRSISTLEVIRAIDGPIVLANCFTEEAACGHSGKCTVKRPLRRIHEGILRLLDNVSIQDMLSDDGGPGPSEPSPSRSTNVQKFVPLESAPKLHSLSGIGRHDLHQAGILTI